MSSRSLISKVLAPLFLAVILSVSYRIAAEPETAPGIMVRPIYIELSLAPGETHVVMIEIQNDTERQMPVAIGIWDFDKEGNQTQILAAHTLDSSIASWLSFPAPELSVGPGELGEFPLSITRPEGDPPRGRWGYLVVEPLETLSEMGTGIPVKVRFLVTLVQFDPAHQDRSGAITGMDVEVQSPGNGDDRTLLVSTKFANTCEAILKLEIRYEIRDSTGNSIVSKKKVGLLALPGRERVFSVEIPVEDLPSGEYMVLTIIDYGGDNPVGGQWPFEIPEED